MAIRGAKKKEGKPLYATTAWKFNFSSDVLARIMEDFMPCQVELRNLSLDEYLALNEKARTRIEEEVYPLYNAAKKEDESVDDGDLWLSKNRKITKEQWLEMGKPKERIVRMFNLRKLVASTYVQEAFKHFGYDKIEEEAKERAIQAGHAELWDEKNAKKKEEELISIGFPENLVKEFVECRGRRYDKELMLKHQIRWLTDWRKKDERYKSIRRTCQEESCLKTTHGANLSYLMLRAGGDKDAQLPEKWEETGFFRTIYNRNSFSVNPRILKKEERKRGFVIIAPLKDKSKNRPLHPNGLPEGHIIVRLSDSLPSLVFLIPNWNQKKENGDWYHQQSLLEQAVKFRQITISRRRDKQSGKRESDLNEPGYFRISISFNIPKPPLVPRTKDNTVYLAFGGSGVGIVSPKGEKVILFSIPEKGRGMRGVDKFLPRALAKSDAAIAEWQSMPPSEEKDKMLHRLNKRRQRKLAKGGFWGVDALDVKISRCVPGSKRHQELSALRAKKFAKMANRGKHDVHQATCRRKPRSNNIAFRTLLWHGVHFVVVIRVIRSKPDKIADKLKLERGGILGANQRAQSTDRMAQRITALKRAVDLRGGSVLLHPRLLFNEALTKGERDLIRYYNRYWPSKKERREKRRLCKIFLARKLKEVFEKEQQK